MNRATRDAYGDFLSKIGANEDIFVLDSDLSSSTRTNKFFEKYPDRFINTGIAEANMVGVAAGIASTGKIVFASSFAEFLIGKTYDTIRQSVCYNDENVKLVSTHAGVSAGKDGATHQAFEDIAITRAMPNMRVFVPSDYVSTIKILELVAKDKKPAYIRLSRMETHDIYNENTDFELGKSYIHGNGNDIAIFAYGETVEIALSAKKILEEQNLSVCVIDMYSIKPIDEKTVIDILKKCNKILVVENHVQYGGLFSAISEIACMKYPKSIKFIGINNFGKSGNPKDVFKMFNVTDENIVKEIINWKK